MELLQCAPLVKKKGALGGLALTKKVTVRDLIQLFMHLEQMQGAGVSLLDALADIRDATDHDGLRDIMAEICRDVSEGAALSEAMALHPKVFKPLYVSLIASGEETGDLTSVYLHLIHFLKWIDEMQAKVRKATRYPMILVVVILITIYVMMGHVVPDIVGFIENIDQAIPWYTQWLMNTSDFFADPVFSLLGFPVSGGMLLLLAPVVLFFILKAIRTLSDDMAYRFDTIALSVPIAGPLIRKINIARFAQTFGALFASGIDILKSLDSARGTVANLALAEALDVVYERVQTGAPLSTAFNETGEFPSMVVRILKVGEESGNLTPVLEQVSEFYTKDVDEAIQGLISMIEPFLTMVLGGMIAWIALAVFGPIYSSFENIGF